MRRRWMFRCLPCVPLVCPFSDTHLTSSSDWASSQWTLSRRRVPNAMSWTTWQPLGRSGRPGIRSVHWLTAIISGASFTTRLPSGSRRPFSLNQASVESSYSTTHSSRHALPNKRSATKASDLVTTCSDENEHLLKHLEFAFCVTSKNTIKKDFFARGHQWVTVFMKWNNLFLTPRFFVVFLIPYKWMTK